MKKLAVFEKGKRYGGLDWLKEHEIPLTDEEISYFREKEVTWDKTKTGEVVVKKAKDEKDGEVYFAFTHRAWNVGKTKTEAVKLGKFIESTS